MGPQQLATLARNQNAQQPKAQPPIRSWPEAAVRNDEEEMGRTSEESCCKEVSELCARGNRDFCGAAVVADEFAGLERKSLDVGDRLRVKLIRTDIERGYIDFARIQTA